MDYIEQMIGPRRRISSFSTFLDMIILMLLRATVDSRH
jgi:hypothetical protein